MGEIKEGVAHLPRIQKHLPELCIQIKASLTVKSTE